MLIFSASATADKESRRIKGATYPPLAVWSELHAVAMNDATIRLKLHILRLVAKCFCP